MRLVISLLLAALFTLPVQAKTSAWALKQEEEDINLKIYTRQVEGSSLEEFKGEMLVKTELSAAAALLLDSQAAPQWMHQCERFDIEEQVDELSAVVYFINGAPWPVSDRDAVILTVMSQNPETLVLRADISTVKDLIPEYDDYVRIPHMTGFWQFEPKDEGMVLITYQVHVDPGGSLPSWLANSVVVETPYNTMSNMVDMLKKDKYQNAQIPNIKNAP